MSELLNFPFKNQLSEPDLDPGVPDLNARMNCVPTSIAAGLQFLTGKQFTGEILEHAEYGPTYIGGTAALAYVDYCAKYGVRLYSISSSNRDYLVDQAHKHLALGHPVLCTLKADYTIPANYYDPGLSHVVVFYKDSSGSLTAMNPWTAFAQQNTDAWWSSRMCFGQIWPMEKLSMSGVPKGWKDSNGVLTTPEGVQIRNAFRSWILAHDWNPEDVALRGEVAAEGGGTELDCLYTKLHWTGARGVFVDHYGDLCLKLQAQVKSLQEQLAQTPQPQPAPQVDPSIKQSLSQADQLIQGVMQKL